MFFLGRGNCSTASIHENCRDLGGLMDWMQTEEKSSIEAMCTEQYTEREAQILTKVCAKPSSPKQNDLHTAHARPVIPGWRGNPGVKSHVNSRQGAFEYPCLIKTPFLRQAYESPPHLPRTGGSRTAPTYHLPSSNPLVKGASCHLPTHSGMGMRNAGYPAHSFHCGE